MSLSQKWIQLLDAAGSVPAPSAAIAAATLADAITVTPAVAAPALPDAAPADDFAADTASVTASVAAAALEDSPAATGPPNKTRSDGWSPEEVTRLRDAMRGLDKSSIRSTSMGFWLQIATVGGLQRSPEALHQRWLSTWGLGRRPHTTDIATATLADATAVAIPVDAAASVTASFAAADPVMPPVATRPTRRTYPNGWSPEEVSRLREAMRGFDESSMRISSMVFRAQLARESGFQRSPKALYQRWQIICDEDGAGPMKWSRSVWSPEEDTQLRAAMLGVDESTARSSNMEFWAQLAWETAMQRSPQALYTRWRRSICSTRLAKGALRWTTEEVSRLCEAMRGLDKSTIRSSSKEFWAQLARDSGIQRSPWALYLRWLKMRDVASAGPTRMRWTPEEDTRLREAMRGLDASMCSYTAVSKQFPTRFPDAIRRRWKQLRDFDVGASK